MERKGRKIVKIVANRYKKAGYKVKNNVIKKFNQHRKMEVDLIAEKDDKKYIVEIKSGKQTLTSSDIMKLRKKANKLRKKPALLITRKVKLTGKARKLAKELGIKIKIIKFRR